MTKNFFNNELIKITGLYLLKLKSRFIILSEKINSLNMINFKDCQTLLRTKLYSRVWLIMLILFWFRLLL